ncbi:hypothetical protein ACFL5P_00695 [candidate division KSB1 bacterium]
MEDELEQEGMDEEVSEPSKSKGGGGSPLKMIVIVAVMAVIAVYVVFFSGMINLGDSEPPPDTTEETIPDFDPNKYGLEYKIEDMSHSMTNQLGRIKNFIITATFVTNGSGVTLLTNRDGLVRYIISKKINKFGYESLMEQTNKDLLMEEVRDSLNMVLPQGGDEPLIQSVFLQLITM